MQYWLKNLKGVFDNYDINTMTKNLKSYMCCFFIKNIKKIMRKLRDYTRIIHKEIDLKEMKTFNIWDVQLFFPHEIL